LDVASALGRGLAAAGVTVVSGMALGIDAAAHEGALASTGATLAVLPGGADRPYPASKRGLYRRIRERGAALSELPPGAPPWRWCFPARNRVIAGLAEVTVVVEGGERSGSLITADFAGELGREVAAVPGRVSSPLAEGPNGLIVSGAHPVRHAADVLDLLFGPGRRPPPPAAPALPGRLPELLDAVAGGADSVGALVGRGVALADVLAGLGQLELLGRVRRTPDGRYVARPADAPGDQAPGSSSPASSSPSC
jgi:DNA processing protein